MGTPENDTDLAPEVAFRVYGSGPRVRESRIYGLGLGFVGSRV